MKFSLTFLEILVFFTVCAFILIWTKHGRKIHRWLQDYFQKRWGNEYGKYLCVQEQNHGEKYSKLGILMIHPKN